jgi:hypothetical protein
VDRSLVEDKWHECQRRVAKQMPCECGCAAGGGVSVVMYYCDDSEQRLATGSKHHWAHVHRKLTDNSEADEKEEHRRRRPGMP